MRYRIIFTNLEGKIYEAKISVNDLSRQGWIPQYTNEQYGVKVSYIVLTVRCRMVPYASTLTNICSFSTGKIKVENLIHFI